MLTTFLKEGLSEQKKYLLSIQDSNSFIYHKALTCNYAAEQEIGLKLQVPFGGKNMFMYINIMYLKSFCAIRKY